MATAAPGLTPEMVAAIDKLADFKVKNGEQFEALIRTKQRDNPTFAFLFDEASPGHAYYHRKVQEYTQAGLAALPAPGTMPPAPGTMPPYPNMAWAGTHQPTPMHAQFAPQQHPFAPQQQPYPVPPHPQPPQPFGLQPLPQPHLVAQHFAAQQHMMQQQQQQQACAMAAGFSPYGAPGFPPPLLPNPVPHGGAAATGPMANLSSAYNVPVGILASVLKRRRQSNPRSVAPFAPLEQHELPKELPQRQPATPELIVAIERYYSGAPPLEERQERRREEQHKEVRAR